jgi:ABC-type multidrug transport system ATPase subunit
MHTLSVIQAVKAFGNRKVLTDITLECQTGQIAGVFGRNGSGKSTLLKMIFGTVRADSIDVRIDAKRIDVSEVISRKQVAYLPQQDFLPKDLKVRELIPLYFPDGDKQNEIFYAPRVASMEKKRVSTLSSGELRYLEILLIAHLEHPFLLMDEPFSMIEPLYKEVIKDLLLRLKAKKGIVITDHYFADVLEVTDKNILIAEGVSYAINGREELAKYGYTAR